MTAPWLSEEFAPEATPPADVAATGTINDLPTDDGMGSRVSSLRFTGAAPTLAGLVPFDGVDGQRIHLMAIGGPLTLANEAGTSTPSNRIRTGSGSNVSIPQEGAVWLVYDETAQRWRVSLSPGGASPAGVDGNLQIKAGTILGAAANVTYSAGGLNMAAGGFYSFGAAPATTGYLRWGYFASATSLLTVRDSGGTDQPIVVGGGGNRVQFGASALDLVLAGAAGSFVLTGLLSIKALSSKPVVDSTATELFFGTDSTYTNQWATVRIYGSSFVYIGVGSATRIILDTSLWPVLTSSGGTLFIGTNTTWSSQAANTNIYAGSTVAIGIVSTTYFYANGASTNSEIGRPMSGPTWITTGFRAEQSQLTMTADVMLSAAQAASPMLRINSATASWTITAPDNYKVVVWILNASTYAQTFKKAGGTGVVIPPGTAKLLVHNGTDYEDWSQPGLDPSGNGLRLSLDGSYGVPLNDVTGATSIYLTPYESSWIFLFDGARWTNRRVLVNATLALSGLTTGKNYDVFAYWTGSAVALELSSAWTSDTARSDALISLDGVRVKATDTTRRWVGTIRATSATTTEDSALRRFVYNANNKVRRTLLVTDANASWTYALTAFRQVRGASANRVEVVFGEFAQLEVVSTAAGTAGASGVRPIAGIGIDTTTANQGITFGDVSSTNFSSETQLSRCEYDGVQNIGYHAINWLEAISSASSVTLYGVQTGSTTYLRARATM